MALIPRNHHHPKHAPRPHCPACGGERVAKFGPNNRCIECGQIFKPGSVAKKNPKRRKPTTKKGAALKAGQWVAIPGGKVRIRKTAQGQALEYQRATTRKAR